MLPLYVCIPLSFLPLINLFPDTTVVLCSIFVLSIVAKLVLLRKYLLSMATNLYRTLVDNRKQLLPIIPMILAIAYVVVWVRMANTDKFSGTIVAGGRSLHDVKLFSAQIADIFTATRNVYIGAVQAVSFFLFGSVFVWSAFGKRNSSTDTRENDILIIFFLFVAFFCYLLSLGLAFGNSSLYLLLYNYLPYFNYPRVSDRIILLSSFAMAVIMGFIFKYVQEKTKRISVSVLLLILAVVLMFNEYKVLEPMSISILDRGQSIYTYVKNNIKKDGLLLEIPLWPGDSHQSSLYEHYIMYDRVPRVNGYSPLVRKDYIETVFKPLQDLNRGMLGRKQYELLKKMKVQYITVHNNSDIFTGKVSPYGPLTTVRRLKNSPYLKFINIDNVMHLKEKDIPKKNLYLFRVKDNVDVKIDDKQKAWYVMPDIYSANHNRMRQQVGEVAQGKGGNKVYQAIEGKDKPGFLLYGPYIVYPPGKYRCYFTYRTEKDSGESSGTDTADSTQSIARIEVMSFLDDRKQIALAQSELQGGQNTTSFRSKYLDFSLQKNSMLEFRVFYHGHGSIQVEQITVYKQGDYLPLNLIEAERMAGDTGEVVYEKDASGGKAVESLAGVSHRGDMVYGPNRMYPKGRYQATYYIRRKNINNVESSKVAAVISVTNGENGKTFARRDVSVGELTDVFTGKSIEFDLEHSEDLSFHLAFTDSVTLELDRIEIKKI